MGAAEQLILSIEMERLLVANFHTLSFNSPHSATVGGFFLFQRWVAEKNGEAEHKSGYSETLERLVSFLSFLCIVGGPERKPTSEPSGLHMAMAVPTAGKVSL